MNHANRAQKCAPQRALQATTYVEYGEWSTTFSGYHPQHEECAQVSTARLPVDV